MNDPLMLQSTAVLRRAGMPVALCCCLGMLATAAAEEATPPAAGTAPQAGAPAESDAPTATITVAPVRQGQLTRALTVYGTVVPATGSTQVIAVACDVVIDQWTVPVGAPLPAKAILGRAHITAETVAARNEAFAAEVAAHDDLRVIRARHDLKLATQQDLLQAVNAAQIAEVRATAWRTRCREEQVVFFTPVVGFLLSANVTAGQTISAGTPIAIVSTGAQEARLGIEPADAQALGSNAQFLMSVAQQPALHLPPTAASVISAIVDPDTRLLTALVPMGTGQVPFGSAITATVDRLGPTGLLVPRGSLVREDGGWCVFTIEDEAAHHHVVTLLAESGTDAAISAADLRTEQLVAVTGSGVLTEGMRVQSATPAEVPAKPGDTP